MKAQQKQQLGLREDQTYAEAARSMLMDSGIKTEVAVDVLFQDKDEQFAVLNALGIQNDSSITTDDDE